MVESDAPPPRKAVIHINDLAIVCTVAEVPRVGDLIYGDIAAVVDKVCVNRDGRVRIHARPAPTMSGSDGYSRFVLQRSADQYRGSER